jgi:RNA polymerase sigma factor (TIGR02999 family)
VASANLSFVAQSQTLIGVPTDALFTTLYSELHRLARRELARRGVRGSLSVTTLLHEAYLNMSARAGTSFPDQARFMGYAARVMRGLIVDYARSRFAAKRGGEFELIPLETGMTGGVVGATELSAISEALDRLEKIEPELAEVVDLKFFCGLSFAEIAALQNLSERTVQRRWEKARIYLRRSLSTELAA